MARRYDPAEWPSFKFDTLDWQGGLGQTGGVRIGHPRAARRLGRVSLSIRSSGAFYPPRLRSTAPTCSTRPSSCTPTMRAWSGQCSNSAVSGALAEPARRVPVPNHAHPPVIRGRTNPALSSPGGASPTALARRRPWDAMSRMRHSASALHRVWGGRGVPPSLLPFQPQSPP